MPSDQRTERQKEIRMAGIRIIGLGKSTGDQKISNDDLSKSVDTSDAWIREKSGIESRYFAKEKSNSDMALEAAEMAISDAGIDKSRIGYIIVCTFTPDAFTPSVACHVAGRLHLRENVMAMDLNGACTGFIYGCNTVNGMLATEKSTEKTYGLVIGSEKISPFMDMKDRTTCVLFGDGAGAAVVEYESNSHFNFYGGCQPREDILHCYKDAFIEMSGQEVYRFAVSKVPSCIDTVINASGIGPEEIDWFVCHQANERIIDHVARKFKGQTEKFYKNLYQYGNTSAASIPLALCDMAQEGLLRNGNRIVCTGFGAGLTFGSMLIEIKR